MTRVIATINDVSNFKELESEFNSKFSNYTIRYDLKSTDTLPEYAKIITMVSSVIMIVLAFFLYYESKG